MADHDIIEEIVGILNDGFPTGEVMKAIPKYAIFPIILLIVLQSLVYFGTQFINRNLIAYDLTIHGIDDVIPVVTFFIVFYILSYPWWFISPVIVTHTGKERFYDWILSVAICYLICSLIFIIFPTTIIRPTIENHNIFDWLTNFIYQNDSPEHPINLFPSFHCLISWFCYIGVRKQENIARWYRIGAVVFAILICLSTQFVKQHYLVDLIGGVVLAETVFSIVHNYHFGRVLGILEQKKGASL
jgi:membrane-associated phospholipid phosphatase